MGLQTSGLVFVLLLSCTFGIQLDGNGYTGVLFAINPAVPEENGQKLIQSIEDMIKDASEYLYRAVGNRFYFKEVTILVPANWTNMNYERAKTERYDKANVIIDEPNQSYGDEPYTLQYGQCGDEGQYIHFTPDFLLDDKSITSYGTRGKVFVHEWAHLRWGLYDEYSEEQPFYQTAQGTIEATRCSLEIKGERCNAGSTSGSCSPCKHDPTTGLPTSDCQFVPDKQTSAKESIMAFQSLDSVAEFCSANTHNAEAPNRQNQMCGYRAALDVILYSSVDAGVSPPSSPIPNIFPAVRRVQRKTRVVCLTLDVSGSMSTSNRIMLLQQAATLFLREIIEDTASVGLVQFSTNAEILKHLTVIDGEESREKLVSALPTQPGGYTNMCQGIKKAMEVLKQHDHTTKGEEIVLLTDGEATDKLEDCLDIVTNSGAIVHTIALGPNADKTLQLMQSLTGGIFFKAEDSLDSNELVDVFASLTTSDGNLTHQAVQLESSGMRTPDWFNGTFSVDWTVGKNTVITIVYENSQPGILIRSPSGESFNNTHFNHETSTKTLSWKIPGNAEVGQWDYRLLNTNPIGQAMAITVTSRAASVNVPPITVRAHMNQKSADGSQPMVVYAAVTQKGLPVILAKVTATLQSDTGHKEELQLLDNGAGADAFKDDGIYSRYFTKLKSGRYSLKVRVQNQRESMLSSQRHSGALYIPGYVVNGQVELNPPKPPVNHKPVEVGSFSRTATGESFVVTLPPGSTGPPAFPPCRITDLRARLEGDNVTLTWTAPGESYDQGAASLYHIHWSEDLALLISNFNDTPLVNTSGLSPQEAGFTEEHSFIPHNLNITNGTRVFFAIAAENADSLRSEMSNIARVVKFIPAPPSPQQPKTNVVAIAVGGSVGLVAVVLAIGGIIYWKKC